MASNRVWGDILGVGPELVRYALLWAPGEGVDELTILDVRNRRQWQYEAAHISLPGSRWSHNTVS